MGVCQITQPQDGRRGEVHPEYNPPNELQSEHQLCEPAVPMDEEQKTQCIFRDHFKHNLYSEHFPAVETREKLQDPQTLALSCEPEHRGPFGRHRAGIITARI